MVGALERGLGGTYNATGPARPVSMQAVLEACRAASRVEAELVWLDEAFLAAQGVAPWKDLPLWLPESDPKLSGMMDAPIERAVHAGLAFRPLAETVADTLHWATTQRPERPWKAGLDAGRERELITAWRPSARRR
jgi:2'-hydroxyisoflavone reductase